MCISGVGWLQWQLGFGLVPWQVGGGVCACVRCVHIYGDIKGVFILAFLQLSKPQIGLLGVVLWQLGCPKAYFDMLPWQVR